MDTPNGFQYALETTSTPGLIIVGALGFLSVLTWSVLLTKWSVLRQARKRNAEYLDLYRKMRHPLDIYEQGLDRRGTPLYSIYSAGARELCLQMLGTAERDQTFSARLRNSRRIAPTQMSSITLSMERAIGEMSVRLEEKMSLLATCVSGAPFLGLLGTVWGVMDTFAAVAASNSGASIQDMAPGVSGALVTTVIGLLIAIPAMFGYNHLIQSIKKMVMLLDHHAAELGAAYERHYVDHGATAHPPAPPPLLADESAPVPVELPIEEPVAPEPPPREPEPMPPTPAAVALVQPSPFTPLLEDEDAVPEPMPMASSPATVTPKEQPVLSGLEDLTAVPLAKPMRPPNMRRRPFELDEDEPEGEPRALPPAP
ncbi:MAG: MotA/TolQ/ExbB proton channel family protein [Verrucomicrobiales bacterium]